MNGDIAAQNIAIKGTYYDVTSNSICAALEHTANGNFRFNFIVTLGA